MKTKIIGLTGPIAAGKNEVAKILRRRGAYVIDADELGHDLLAPQSDTWKKIVKAFGSKVLMAGGRINRKRLGEIVFSDKKALKKLDGIMHPRIKEEVKLEIRKLKVDSRKLIVVNAAVLKEIGLIPLVDEVWVVLASKQKRIRRLISKGLTKQEAVQRISSQARDAAFKKIADVTINNDGTLASLMRRVCSIIED